MYFKHDHRCFFVDIDVAVVVVIVTVAVADIVAVTTAFVIDVISYIFHRNIRQIVCGI